jgi:hypothetical protein
MANTTYPGAVVIDSTDRNGARLVVFEFTKQQLAGNVPIPIGNGSSHLASAYYATLAACQADYPMATALTNEIAQLSILLGISSMGSRDLVIPAGNYRWDNSGGLWTIAGFSGRMIFQTGATILFTSNTNVGIQFLNSSNFEIEGFTADYVTTPTSRGASDAALVMTNCADFSMRRTRILSSRNAGIVWNLCVRGVAYDTKVTYCQADGFFKANCMDSLIDGCELEFNGDDDFSVHNFHRTLNPTVSSSVFTQANHYLVNNQAVYFSAPGGTLPSPLVQNTASYSTPYYVIVLSSSTFQVSATPGPGSPLTLTGGSGTIICIVGQDVGATWSSGTTYTTGQFATYAGILYQAIQGNTNQRPDRNVAYWSLAYQQLPNGIFKGIISRGSAASGISCLGGLNAQFAECEVYDAALQSCLIATDGNFGSFIPAGVDADIRTIQNAGSQGQLIHGPTGTGAGQAGHPLDAVRVTDCASAKLRNMAPDISGVNGSSILVDCPNGDIELDNCSGFNSPYIGIFLTALRLHIPGKLRVENSGDRGIYIANCGTVVAEGGFYIKNCSQTSALNRAYDFDTVASLYVPGGITIEDTQATPTGFRGRDSGVSFGVVGAINDLITNSPASAWSSGTAYTPGQLSTFSGQLYESILSGTNHQPDISPTYWIPIFGNFVLDHGSTQLAINGVNSSSTPQSLVVGDRLANTGAGRPFPQYNPAQFQGQITHSMSPPTTSIFGNSGVPGVSGDNNAVWDWNATRLLIQAISQGVSARLIALNGASPGDVSVNCQIDLGALTVQLASNVLVALNTAITDGGASPLRDMLNVTWDSGSSSYLLQAITHGSFLPLVLQPLGGFTTLGPAGLKFNDATVQTTAFTGSSGSPLGTTVGGTGLNEANPTALINALLALIAPIPVAQGGTGGATAAAARANLGAAALPQSILGSNFTAPAISTGCGGTQIVNVTGSSFTAPAGGGPCTGTFTFTVNGSNFSVTVGAAACSGSQNLV